MFAIDAQQTVLGVWHSQGSARAHQQQLQLVQAAEARQRPAVIKPQERLFLHADGCELGNVGWTREIALPGLPQIRTCGTTASGSSNHGLASGRQIE